MLQHWSKVHGVLADLREVGPPTVRLSRDLPGFLHRTVELEQAEARLRRNLEQREHRFLALADRAIFGNPRSPYLPLLRHAGCEAGDLHALVLRDGLDAALQSLAQQGVMVAHDEARGIRDAVRGSARFRFTEDQFDNPCVPAHLLAETGGSSGRPVRVQRNLGVLDDLAGWVRVAQAAHDVVRPRHAFWMTGPLWWALIYGRLNQPVDGWFHPMPTLPWQVRAGMAYLRLLGRLGGQRWPRPSPCDLSDPAPLVRWLGQRVRQGQGDDVVLTTASSAGVRVAVAAQQAGIDLTGVTFVVKSEPLTAARRALMEEVGGRVLALYGSMEVPPVASGCATPAAPDDMHLAEDCVAGITRRRPAGEGGPLVDAFLVTTLAPATAKVWLNVEIGDYATVKTRDCGCLLGRLGLRTHLSGVRGFDKLTGEGVTFLRAHLEPILEQALPARFGGSALDYQIVEDEGVDGLPRLVLRIAPRVGPVDPEEARAALLRELGSRGGIVQQHMAALWRRAETLRVDRTSPELTRTGKVMPFVPLRAPAPAHPH